MNTVEQAVTDILVSIEKKVPLRPGIVETPKRVAKAYEEMFNGYNIDIERLFKTFDDEGKDQIVAIKDIKFTSMCEHHMLPFTGYAHVAYLPDKEVIGASKLPRLVLAYAHRLQLQERITQQVADALQQYLKPRGVAVIIQAQHSCMSCRGVKCEEGKLVTSVMHGLFKDDPVTKQEVLALLGIIK